MTHSPIPAPSRLLLAAAALAAPWWSAACGTATVTPPPPMAVTPTPSPQPVQPPQPTPCAGTTAAPLAGGGGVTLASAALLRLTVVVAPVRDPAPHCVTLPPATGFVSVVHLDIGDRLEYEANSAPQLSAAEQRVVVATQAQRPTPAALPSFGPFGPPNPIVTLTAVGAGTVNVTYINCHGTGC